MEIYIVQEFSREDYDFSTDVKTYGAYTDRSRAVERAKEAFESLRKLYADEIDQYTPKEDVDDDDNFEDFDEDGEVEFYVNDEKGFYSFSFGSEENYELHEVQVVECVLYK